MTAVYGAAKAGLLSATKSLAMEWGPKVRVNAIIAGFVVTEHSHDHYGGEEGIERISQMSRSSGSRIRRISPQPVCISRLRLRAT